MVTAIQFYIWIFSRGVAVKSDRTPFQCFFFLYLSPFPGAFIRLDVLSVHFNEDLWDPLPANEFHPEWHETKRHPMSFLFFGAGPRTCIGARFALSALFHSLQPTAGKAYVLRYSKTIHRWCNAHIRVYVWTWVICIQTTKHVRYQMNQLSHHGQMKKVHKLHNT